MGAAALDPVVLTIVTNARAVVVSPPLAGDRILAGAVVLRLDRS